MAFFKFTADQIVKRLRWMMVGTMIFEMIITLLGQRNTYWNHPETAHEINQGFDFFLSRGWLAYFFISLIYISGAFLFVSVLPRKASLIAIFSFILSHYFGASNWLAIHWHLGIKAPVVYGFMLCVIIVLVAFPIPDTRDKQIIQRLRWVMTGAIIFDWINTFLGQPHSYWHRPETVNESNGLSYFFLSRGYMSFCIYEVAYIAVIFLLVSILPRMPALVCVFAFIFGHFAGASNWFYFRWEIGMAAPVIYGVMLSAIIVSLAFPASGKINLPENFLET
jgi:hypothetical protein